MIPYLLNMQIFLKHWMEEQDSRPYAKKYAQYFMAEMTKRFPTTGVAETRRGIILGAGIELYCLALFVHPFYRGNLLKKVSNKEFQMR